MKSSDQTRGEKTPAHDQGERGQANAAKDTPGNAGKAPRFDDRPDTQRQDATGGQTGQQPGRSQPSKAGQTDTRPQQGSADAGDSRKGNAQGDSAKREGTSGAKPTNSGQSGEGKTHKAGAAGGDD